MAEYECKNLTHKDKFRIRIFTNHSDRSRKTIIRERYGYLSEDAADLDIPKLMTHLNCGKSLKTFVSTFSPPDNLFKSIESNKRSNETLNSSSLTIKKSKVQLRGKWKKKRRRYVQICKLQHTDPIPLQEWRDTKVQTVQDMFTPPLTIPLIPSVIN